MGCTSSSNAESPHRRSHTVHIVEHRPIDYAQILSKVSFRRKFVAQSLDDIWTDNPLHKFIDNRAILTFFHIPSIKRSPATRVAKCYDPDLHCNSTNIFLCPYRWKLNEPSYEEFCHELPVNEFRELRTLIQNWQDQGFSLRLVKKMPGSDKPQVQNMFPPDKMLHCVLQCVFQNCDYGIGYKILGMPWVHKFGKNGFLDYEFPDIAGIVILWSTRLSDMWHIWNLGRVAEGAKNKCTKPESITLDFRKNARSNIPLQAICIYISSKI